MPGSPLSAPREIRFRWYLQVEKYRKTIQEVCTIFGISRKTYYKWYQRDHGYTSSSYHPKRPHLHTKLTAEMKTEIENTKHIYNYGPMKMRIHLLKKRLQNVPSSTVIYRYYRRKRLIRKPQRKQEWYTPMKKPFQAQKPGENVQCDVKYVPGKNLSWRYQYRFLDTVTNMQYACEKETRDAQATILALKQATKYFPFSLSGIQTDNGGEFRGIFHTHLTQEGIPYRFIPKRSAPWNGKVERANRSVDDEYYLNEGRPWKDLHAYTDWYNYERPHLGKHMQGMTPYEKFLSLTRSKRHP